MKHFMIPSAYNKAILWLQWLHTYLKTKKDSCKQNRTLFFLLKKNAKIAQAQYILSTPKQYTALKVSTDFFESSITKST